MWRSCHCSCSCDGGGDGGGGSSSSSSSSSSGSSSSSNSSNDRKTQQFRETSSFCEVDNIKNEAILQDFLQAWKVECRADGLVPMCFAIFALHLSQVLRLPRKSEARSDEVLHLSREIIFPKLKV